MDNDDFTLGGFPNPRVATRYVARIRILARIGERALKAFIVDVSNTGVRLEMPAITVAPDTVIRLELPWFPVDQPVSMLAKYVRKTDDGCALRFTDPDPFLRVFVKLGLLQNEITGEIPTVSFVTRF